MMNIPPIKTKIIKSTANNYSFRQFILIHFVMTLNTYFLYRLFIMLIIFLDLYFKI